MSAPVPEARRAVFLDRDGTINEEVHYLHLPEDLRWIPGAPEAIARLNAAGLLVVVVTNQAGVARGMYGEEDVLHLHRHMQRELRTFGARIDAFYYSPYHPEGTVGRYRRHSDLRKPGAGMIRSALADLAIEAEASYLIGDRKSDIYAGRAAGLTTVLVRTGYGAAEEAGAGADFVENDLGAAADRVLALCSTIR